MEPDMFDQLERARQTGGAAGGFDFLIQKFREEKNYPSMFEARLMQKRLELGLDPIQMGSLDDVPADVRPAYERAFVEAAREENANLILLGWSGTVDTDSVLGTTIDEAVQDCSELKRLNAAKVLLVTSAYHSRRANVVFRLFCPGVRFVSVGAPDAEFTPESWWKTPHHRKIFLSEWGKLVATVLWKYPETKLRYALNLIKSAL